MFHHFLAQPHAVGGSGVPVKLNTKRLLQPVFDGLVFAQKDAAAGVDIYKVHEPRFALPSQDANYGLFVFDDKIFGVPKC